MADKVAEIARLEKNDRVKRLLKAELDAVAARLHRDAETSSAAVDGGNFLDVAQGLEHQEQELLIASRLMEQAKRLRVALKRVNDGEYGVCEECGAPIPAKRLLAVPDATTCVACQDRLERVGATAHAQANGGDDEVEA